MIIALPKMADGRLQAHGVQRHGPGRPPDLSKPVGEIRRGIDRRLEKLIQRRRKLDREIKRWSELRAAFNGDGNGHAA